MIINLLIYLLVSIISGIFIFLPVVTISSIPYIGTTVASSLLWFVHIWNAFVITFPYAENAMNIFLYVIIPFETLMLLGRFFLGHRMPVNHIN